MVIEGYKVIHKALQYNGILNYFGLSEYWLFKFIIIVLCDFKKFKIWIHFNDNKMVKEK